MEYMARPADNDSWLFVNNGHSDSSEFATVGPDMSGCSQENDSYHPALKNFYYAYGSAHGYFSMLVSIFGILSNVANIVVLTRKNMRSSVNLILMWLAVADFLTMVVYLPFSIYFFILHDSSLRPMVSHSQHWNLYLLIFSHTSVVFHTCAIWLTIDLAVFRVLYILLPTKGPQLCSMTRAKIAVVSTIAAVTVTAVPNYLSNGAVLLGCNGQTVYTVEYSQLAMEHPALPNANYWIQATLFKLVPCTLLTILTVLLVHTMHQANKRRMKLKSQGKKDESNRQQETNRTTGMLLAVVVLFLITELPQGIFTILSGTQPGFFEQIYTPLGDLMDILALLNNSVNFVLYCTMSRQFRQTFANIFCKWLPKPPYRRQSSQKTNGVSADISASVSTEMTKMLNNNGDPA